MCSRSPAAPRQTGREHAQRTTEWCQETLLLLFQMLLVLVVLLLLLLIRIITISQLVLLLLQLLGTCSDPAPEKKSPPQVKAPKQRRSSRL